MTKYLYTLLAICFLGLATPLSISAQNGCEGVTLTGNVGNITITGLGSYTHIQVFTQYYAGQVYNQELRVSSVTVPIATAGNYIVKVWSNPNTADFCERDFPVVVPPSGGNPPVANNDSGVTPQNTPISTPVLNNDNLNGNPLQMLIVRNRPSNGTAVVSGNNIIYTPNAGFCGDDLYTYKIVTADGSSTATVNITVTCPALLPVANNDAVTTPQNTPIGIAVLTNDQINGTLQSVTQLSNPLNGTVTLNALNQFIYTPNAGFSGIDRFTYRITNQNGTSNVATVTISVPRNATPPLAVNDATTTPQSTPVTISVLSNDQINGTLQSVILVSPPNNGTVTLNALNQFVYTPNAGFSGTDQFTYRITNQDGTSNVATVTIFVPPSDPCVVSPVSTPTATITSSINGQANGCINITNLPTGATSSINGGAATTNKTQYCNLTAGTYTIKVNRNGCIKTANFTIINVIACDNVTNGGTIIKSCLNGTVVLSNVTAPSGGSGALEYIWLVSTTGCPTHVSQAIANATSANLTCTPSSVKRYFVRYARRANCPSATFYRASNCITVNALECATTTCNSTQTDRCVTISLLRIQRHASGEACLVFNVTNNCTHNLAHVAISLPAGVRAANGTTYTSPSGNKYSVLNPATIPFYGLRFDATSGYIGRGSSEIFAFNMPANVPIPSSIQVAVKCSDFVYSVNLTTNCTNNYNQHLIAERLDIEAQAEQNWARIEWVSNTGEKNDYFTVEKASTATGEFETLETVNNKVYDNSAAHYVVYDNAPTEGENIYRLKSVFTDGTIKISNTKTLVFKGLNDVRTFPTPVNDILNIDLSNYRNEAAEVYLYNYFGQQVGYQKVDNVGGGLLEMDVANQPTGNYLVRIQSKGKREVTKKIVISH